MGTRSLIAVYMDGEYKIQLKPMKLVQNACKNGRQNF